MDSKLTQLHANLVQKCLEILEKDEPTTNELNLVRTFLKDNDITQHTLPGTDLHKLTEEIKPFETKDCYFQ